MPISLPPGGGHQRSFRPSTPGPASPASTHIRNWNIPMARQKNPLSKARLTGADRKDPQRYRYRTEPDRGGPIGDAPSYLPPDAKRAWEQFRKELPWLQKSDRGILGIVSLLRARVVMSGEPPTSAMIRELRSGLSSLGATPVSRQAVHVPDDSNDDPYGFLDGRPQ